MNIKSDHNDQQSPAHLPSRGIHKEKGGLDFTNLPAGRFGGTQPSNLDLQASPATQTSQVIAWALPYQL